MGNKIMGPVCLFFAFTLAGTGVIVARFVSGRLGIFTITAISLLFAMLFLLASRWRKIARAVHNLPLKGYLALLVQALCGIFLFRMFLLFGLTLTSSLEAGILTSATPAITAVLAMVFLKEKATPGKVAGIVLTVAGVSLIQGLVSRENAFLADHFAGNLLVLCAAACESLFNVFSRAFATKGAPRGHGGLEPDVQTFFVSLLAFLLCLFPAMFEQPVARLGALDPSGWLALMWYGVFVTALAFICWYEGIRRMGALAAAAFSGMMPLTSALLSLLLLGESFAPLQLTGGLMILAGMVWLGMGAARGETAGHGTAEKEDLHDGRRMMEK